MTGSNQHSRLPITSLAEAQGYIEHLEEQLEALQRERDEVIRPAVLDTVAEYRAQVEGLQEQFDAMRDFLVDLVDSEWGKQTPPYTGSFEPMNQWITSNPAREPMEDS